MHVLSADGELERYLAELHYAAEVLDITGSTARVPRAWRDDIVLPSCLASGADYLRTRDDDLLSLRPDYSIPTAREFYDQQLRQDRVPLCHGTRIVIGLSTGQALTFFSHFWLMSILSQQYVPDSSDNGPGLRSGTYWPIRNPKTSPTRAPMSHAFLFIADLPIH